MSISRLVRRAFVEKNFRIVIENPLLEREFLSKGSFFAKSIRLPVIKVRCQWEREFLFADFYAFVTEKADIPSVLRHNTSILQIMADKFHKDE